MDGPWIAVLEREPWKHFVNRNTAAVEGVITAGNCSEHTCLFDHLLERETNLKLPAQFPHYLNEQEEDSKVKIQRQS